MAKRNAERRNVAQRVELRAAPDGSDSPGTLAGYAAKFNTYSQNLGGFVETIAPGAFDKSLADDVRMLCRYNHDDMALLGTTTGGSLRVSADNVGLLYECDLPDTAWGNDCAVLAARGDLQFSSFAFYAIDDEWGESPQGFPMRTLNACQLVDVAPVNTPAYMDTSTALRSMADAIHVDFETLRKASAEEVRSLAHDGLTSEEAPDEQVEKTAETEQRATHSIPVSIRTRELELDALQ